ADEQIDARVQTDLPVFEARRPNLEQRPLVRLEDLMRHRQPDIAQGFIDRRLFIRAEIENFDLIGQNRLEYLLPAVGQYDRAQHLVTSYHALKSVFESLQV